MHTSGRIRIVSGGQTGVDTAALAFALRHGLAHGGWCPRGRRRETGRIPRRYRLRETPRSGYRQRTRWNVRDADATVLFTLSPRLKGGTLKTARFARELGKPLLHLAEKPGGQDPAALLRAFLRRHRVKSLNVAGPRRSEAPGAGAFARRVLGAALGLVGEGRARARGCGALTSGPGWTTLKPGGPRRGGRREDLYMGSKARTTKSRMAAQVLELFQACPFDRCNPGDCPLHPLRGLRPGQRAAWLNRLTEDDLSYLVSYHYVCLSMKTGLAAAPVPETRRG